jgi:hypothetical protein
VTETEILLTIGWIKMKLKGIDSEHFWYGEVMIDIAQLKYEANNLENGATGATIHGLRTVTYMLDHYARNLAGTLSYKPTPATPEKVEKYLRMANKLGLHTGVVFDA